MKNSIKSAQEEKFKDILRSAQIGVISQVIDHVDVEHVPRDFLNSIIPSLSTLEAQKLVIHVSSLCPNPRVEMWQDYLLKSIFSYQSPGILIYHNGSAINLIQALESTDTLSKANMEKALISLEFLKRIDPSIKISEKFLDKQITQNSSNTNEFLKLMTRLHLGSLLPNLDSLSTGALIKRKIVQYLVSQSLNKTYGSSRPVKNFVSDLLGNPLSQTVAYEELFNDIFNRLNNSLNTYLANTNIKLLATNQHSINHEIANFICQVEDFVNCHNKHMGDKLAFYNNSKSNGFCLKLIVFLEHIKSPDILKQRVINFHSDFKNRKTEDFNLLIKKHPSFQSINFNKISRASELHLNYILKSLSLDKSVSDIVCKEIAAVKDYSNLSNEFLEKLSLLLRLPDNSVGKPAVKIKI